MDRASSTQSIEVRSASCRHLGRSRRYQCNHGALDPLCVQCALLYRPVCHRALRIALVAGTILTLINQGELTPMILLKTGLTYAAQYAVSTLSVLQANRLP